MPRSKESFEEMKLKTKNLIENSALELFARKGLSITIKEIATNAGISQGLIYSHYTSKDQLIHSLVNNAMQISSSSIMELAQSNLDAVSKITYLSEIMCDMLQQSHIGRLNFMFMLQVGLSGKFSYNDDLVSSPIVSLAQIITRGQGEGSVVLGEAHLLSLTYWSAVQGMCGYVVTGINQVFKPQMLSRILLKEKYL